MRIIVLSSFFPPYFLGGYELKADQIVNALRERNHEVYVLTSKYGINRKMVNGGVFRVLDARSDVKSNMENTLSVLKTIKIEYDNHRIMKQVIKRVDPDVFLVMHVHSLLKSLLLTLQHTNKLIVYDIDDPGLMTYPNSRDNWNKWFDWWESKSTVPLKKYVKYLLQKFVSSVVPTFKETIILNHSYFSSNTLKLQYFDTGFQVKDKPVLSAGIYLSDFPFVKRDLQKEKIKLLYTGRIASEKGILTAIEALPLIKAKTKKKIQLSIIGPNSEEKYLSILLKTVKILSLEKEVIFLPQQSYSFMPSIYQDHDIFVFPAVWEEPFGRAWVEALSSGLPLITTATGCAGDYLSHKENCLIFSPNDKIALAESILSILQNSKLCDRISQNGRLIVEKYFPFDKFVDKVEKYLEKSLLNF